MIVWIGGFFVGFGTHGLLLYFSPWFRRKLSEMILAALSANPPALPDTTAIVGAAREYKKHWGGGPIPYSNWVRALFNAVEDYDKATSKEPNG